MGIGESPRLMLSSHRLQRAAAYWIFPGLVVAMVAGNEGWTVGPFLVGQMISWVNDAAAVVLALGRFRGRPWVPLVVGATIAAKVITIAGIAPARADLAFDIFLSSLFCAAGAVVVSERPGIVYRQLIVIAALSVPVMLVQMTGVLPVSEALNTEHTEDPAGTSRTLFVPEADLHYRTAQARPSGLTHSNNFLSLLAALAAALHFAMLGTPRLTRRDVLVCTFVLLTMAKVALLVLLVVLLWKLLTGLPYERLRIVRVFGLAGMLLACYGALFPGLLAENTSLYKITYSFMIRANDFVALLPADSALKRWLAGILAGTPKAGPHQSAGLSGYAQIIGILPYALVAAVVAAPVFLRGVRGLLRRYPQVVNTTVAAGIVALLYPAAVPMFRAQIYWFVAGFALVPAFLTLDPARFRGSIGVLWPAHRLFRETT